MQVNALNSNLLTNQTSAKQIDEKNKTENFAKALEKATKKDDKVALQKAAEDFEAIFLNMILQSMRKTVPENGLIAKSNGEKIFESMLDQSYAEQMAHAGGIGLSKMIVEQLSRNL